MEPRLFNRLASQHHSAPPPMRRGILEILLDSFWVGWDDGVTGAQGPQDYHHPNQWNGMRGNARWRSWVTFSRGPNWRNWGDWRDWGKGHSQYLFRYLVHLLFSFPNLACVTQRRTSKRMHGSNKSAIERRKQLIFPRYVEERPAKGGCGSFITGRTAAKTHKHDRGHNLFHDGDLVNCASASCGGPTGCQ